MGNKCKSRPISNCVTVLRHVYITFPTMLYMKQPCVYFIHLKLSLLYNEGQEHRENLHGQHVSICTKLKNERLRNFMNAKITKKEN